jgi:arylsulfatase A-like enzyme
MDNIVFIVADTLRNKELRSSRGKAVAPFLEEKTKIPNYYSNSPWTVPAHATLFSGELPSEHGATTENTFFNGSNELIECFKENGYKTIGLTENSLLDTKLGFGEQFDEFGDSKRWSPEAYSWNKIWEKDSSYESRFEKYSDFSKLLIQNRDFKSLKALKEYLTPRFEEEYNPTKSQLTIQKSLDLLNQNEDTFLFVNLMPVHAKYTFEKEQKEIFLPELSEEEIRRVTGFDTLSEYLESGFSEEDLFQGRQKAYNASIRYLDCLIKKFYKKAPDNTLFIVVGDHGELIGEYEKNGTKLVNHHFGTFKELIRVPLYIFSKEDNFSLEIEEGLHDHIELHNFLLSLAEEDSAHLKSKDLVKAEYFGKIGFDEQFGLKTPKEFEKLFRRKSFSIIDKDYKYDLTSEAKYLWKQGSSIEEQNLGLDKIPEEVRKKGDILYSWRLEGD